MITMTSVCGHNQRFQRFTISRLDRNASTAGMEDNSHAVTTCRISTSYYTQITVGTCSSNSLLTALVDLLDFTTFPFNVCTSGNPPLFPDFLDSQAQKAFYRDNPDTNSRKGCCVRSSTHQYLDPHLPHLDPSTRDSATSPHSTLNFANRPSC